MTKRLEQTYPDCSNAALDQHYFIRDRSPEWDIQMAQFATRSAATPSPISEITADIQ
jgi:hypothetical protein